MKNSFKFITFLTAIGCSALSVQAAPLTWDITSGDGSSITGGIGTWIDGAGNWNTGAGDANWSNANPDSATFGGTAGTVTLGGAITTGGLTFNSGYTVNGGGYTLTLSGAATIKVTNLADTATINSDIAGTGDITFGEKAQTVNSTGYLSASSGTPTTFTNVSLSNLTAANGTLGGGWITAGIGQSYLLSNNGTTASYWLEVLDGGFTKGVKVVLTQNGSNIDAYVSMARYTSSSVVGTDLSGYTSAPVAGSATADGYGARTTALTFGYDALGTVLLTGNNTYSGNTSISSGTLEIGGSGTLGTGSYAGTISNGGTLKINSTSDQTLSGVISGAGALTKASSGTLTISGGNSYTGATTINAGTLKLGHATALGTTAAGTSVTSGAVLDLNGQTITNAEALTLNGTGISSGGALVNSSSTAASYAGVVTIGSSTTVGGNGNISLNNGISGGTFTLANVGSGTLTLGAPTSSKDYTLSLSGSGAVNLTGTAVNFVGLRGDMSTYAGTITTSGLVYLKNGTTGNLDTGSTLSKFVVGSGTTLLVSNNDDGTTANTTVSMGELSGAGTIYGNGYVATRQGTKTLSIGALNTDSTFSGVIANAFSGGGAVVALTKTGSGKLTLSGANTYTGGTTINSGGSLQLGDGGATGKISTSSAITNNGNLTINRSNAVVQGTDFSTAAITGTGSFTAAGTGTVTLNSANSYSGGTTVNAGADLRINGAQTGAGEVTVAAGGKLGGSGSVIGGINVSGTLAPGNSIESFGGGDLTFITGSTYAYEIQTDLYGTTPGVAADLFDSTGTLDIASGSILTLTDLAASTELANGSKFTLISYLGGWTSAELFTYLGNTLADDSTFTVGANQWLFNYNDTTGGVNYTADQAGATSFVTMTVVPEPGAALLGGLGVLFLLRRHRRA